MLLLSDALELETSAPAVVFAAVAVGWPPFPRRRRWRCRGLFRWEFDVAAVAATPVVDDDDTKA